MMTHFMNMLVVNYLFTKDAKNYIYPMRFICFASLILVFDHSAVIED